MAAVTAWLGHELEQQLTTASAAAAYAALRIALVLAAGYVGMRCLRASATRLEDVLVRIGGKSEMVPGSTRKRITTLTGLVLTLSIVLLWAIVGITVLGQLGLDIAPVLAGAGIVGLAIGFGAQNLVRDVITGFFIVLENQIRVGDVAIVNGTGGLVEAVSFRTIVLRDLAGVVHTIPNGAITTVANMTKGWSAYVLDVRVAYREDTDRVVDVMREAAEALRKDPAFGSMILEPIEVFGIDDFGDSAIVIKARLKTVPMQQWTVGREYRRRLKKAFDACGIEIPVPHRSVFIGPGHAPLDVLLRGSSSPGDPHGSDLPTNRRE